MSHTTNLAQTGVATGSGSTNIYTVGGGVTHDLSRIDTINWMVNATTTSFTDPGSTPYKDYTSAISWNRTLSPTTNWVNSVSFDWFDQDDPAKSQRLFWRLTTGAQIANFTAADRQWQYWARLCQFLSKESRPIDHAGHSIILCPISADSRSR